MTQTYRRKYFDKEKAFQAFENYRLAKCQNKTGVYTDLQVAINHDRALCKDNKGEEEAYAQYGDTLDPGKDASGQLARLFDQRDAVRMVAVGRIASIERVLELEPGSLLYSEPKYGYSTEGYENDIKPCSIFVRHNDPTPAEGRKISEQHSFDVELAVFDTEIEYDDPVKQSAYTATLGLVEAWLDISTPRNTEPIFSEVRRMYSLEDNSATVIRTRASTTTEVQAKWQIKSSNGEPLKITLEIDSAVKFALSSQPDVSFTLRAPLAAIRLRDVKIAGQEPLADGEYYEIRKALQKLLLEKETQRVHGLNRTKDWVLEQVSLTYGSENADIA